MTNEEFRNIIEICRSHGFVKEMAERIAATNNPYYICDFAEQISAADTPEIMQILEDAMLATGDIVHIYEFMFMAVDSGIKNFNLTRFEDAIIESKNPKLMYYIIGYVPGVNIPRLLQAIADTNSLKYIEHAKTDYELPASTSEETFYPETLKKYSTKYLGDIYLQILTSNNPYDINEYAEFYGDVGKSTEKLQRVIIETGDILHIYEFACSVKGADIPLIEEVIIQSGMVKYMYYMYEYLAGTNKDKLRAAIINTGNQKYIDKISGTVTHSDEKSLS